MPVNIRSVYQDLLSQATTHSGSDDTNNDPTEKIVEAIQKGFVSISAKAEQPVTATIQATVDTRTPYEKLRLPPVMTIITDQIMSDAVAVLRGWVCQGDNLKKVTDVSVNPDAILYQEIVTEMVPGKGRQKVILVGRITMDLVESRIRRMLPKKAEKIKKAMSIVASKPLKKVGNNWGTFTGVVSQ